MPAVGRRDVWCAMLVASASAFAASQSGVATYVLDKKGLWRPMVKDAMPEASRQLTPAEIRLIHERLARISGLFNQVKVLNPPMGMEVWPRALVEGPEEAPGS